MSSLSPSDILQGCHDNGYAPSLEGLVTDGFKSKLFLLPGHVEVAASIRQLGLPSLNVPDLFNAPSAPLSTTSPVSAITSPTSPKVKSVGPVQDFAVALNNVFPTISGSTTSSDLQHVAQQKTEGQWMVPLHLKQPTRRSPVVVTPVKLYYLDPNIVCQPVLDVLTEAHSSWYSRFTRVRHTKDVSMLFAVG
jgi:hypothetical protein